VGKLLGVSDNTIVRWCKWRGNPLPHKLQQYPNDKPSSNRRLYAIKEYQLRKWLLRSQAARQVCNPAKLQEFLNG